MGKQRKGRQNLSFDITTPRQFFDKLKKEQQKVEQKPASARHAINAATNAWHLWEWVWGDLKNNQQAKNTIGVHEKKEFEDYCKKKCPELETMQCIAEGSKHLGTQGDNVASTSAKGGAFSSGFSKGFDVSRLQITKTDGSNTYFGDELRAVVDFWEQFFAKQLPSSPPSSP